MNFKIIITMMAIVMVLAGCSAKENHNNTAGTEEPARTHDTANDNVVNDAGDAVNDAANGAGNVVEDVGNGVGNAVEDVADGVGEAVKDAGDGVKNATNNNR